MVALLKKEQQDDDDKKEMCEMQLDKAEDDLEELDKQVEEATVNRKEENEDYQSLMANNGAAPEIIGMAKNRMNKFYNPSMYKESAAFIQLHQQAEKEAPAP